MSGLELYLVDTNIYIHLFNGNINAENALKGRVLYFSYITEIELLGFTGISPEAIQIVKDTLACNVKIDHTETITQKAIWLKQQQKMKTPDAIIVATAILNNLPLLTADKALANIPDLDCILFEG